MKRILSQTRAILASLRLTVFLIALAIVLVFAATIDQVHLGIWAVQEKYIRSFLVWLPVGSVSLPVFPGGYLVGGVFALNLAAAFATRFSFSWRKGGILLAHSGLMLLLVGELLSGLWQQDFQMRLDEGQTRAYAESFRDDEMYVTDVTDPEYDNVVAIPGRVLARGATVQHPALPFRVTPVGYFENAALYRRTDPAAAQDSQIKGAGAQVSVSRLPVTYKPDERNEPAVFVELAGPEGPIGTWLVASVLGDPQRFEYDGRTWEIGLRPRRDYKPFSLTLVKFSHDRYAGTDIPRNFSSRVRLTTPDGRDDREVLIYMNNPLRYGGYTFYQSGFTNDDRTTILQVVRNPSWALPYIACGLMTTGLGWQFLLHLVGFARKRATGEKMRLPASGNPTGLIHTDCRVAAGRQPRSKIPLITLALGLAFLASSFLPERQTGSFNTAAFGALPVVMNGRIKPFDTVARSALLQLQGRQRVTAPNGTSLAPVDWLLDVMAKPAVANTYQTFEIDHPDVLALLGLAPAAGAGGKRFSFQQIAANLRELDRQCGLAENVEASARNAFQNALLRLRDAILTFQQLQMDLAAQPASGQPGGPRVDFAPIGQAWAGYQPETFNALVQAEHDRLRPQFAAELRRTAIEVRFNAAQPFYTSMELYVVAALLAVFSWLKWPDLLGRAAYYLIALAFCASTLGLAARMWLEGRPPVTNLYSSALFVGWMAVGLCLVLERLHRNAIASVAAGAIGFCTLLIAHHLSLTGDTMEMMRAVLDSNFWLATHVVTVTVGYSATFLAGFLALIYVFRGRFTRSLDSATAISLERMVYGIICFATIFSFVGTVLGGIWADQSWGRFWGWDPKENGALIIVLWNALILHARWAGLVRQRGLMALAILGNILTAWSWFGVNMLGVGLHSYGFMGAAFWWLAAFVVSQLVAVGLIGCRQAATLQGLDRRM